VHRVLVNGPAAWNLLVDVAGLPDARPQTLFASGHREAVGGTSAGKALTLAALGADVTLRTVLGDDEQGARVRAALDRPGLRLVAVPARDGRTERHLNLMADDGSRVSVYLELPEPADLPRAADDPHELAARADAVVLDLAGHSRDLLEPVRASGTPLWCDVHDHDGRADFQQPFVDAADVLVVSDARLDDAAAYLRAARDGGCRLAVCTRGGEGALALDADGWWDVPAAPVAEVVDTNGAGDAFLAGLLVATLDGLPVPQALAWASAAGALAVGTTALGAPHASREAVALLARRVDVRRIA
jgi:sugar/nucleoside kinase (ribokinase family)